MDLSIGMNVCCFLGDSRLTSYSALRLRFIQLSLLGILSWFMLSVSLAQAQLIFTAEWEGNSDVYYLMNGEVIPFSV